MKRSRKIRLMSGLLVLVCPFNPVNATANSHPSIDGKAALGWIKRSEVAIRQSIQDQHYIQKDVYTVQWGDTLGSIANATNHSLRDLIQINQIDDPDLIIPGMKIYFSQSPLAGRTPLNQPGVNEEEADYFETTQPMNSLTEVSAEEGLEVPDVNLKASNEEEETQNRPLNPPMIAVEADEWEPTENEAAVSVETDNSAIESVDNSAVLSDSATPSTDGENVSPETNEIETSTLPFEDPQAAFADVVKSYGVSTAEQEMWASIIEGESGWDYQNTNPYSGAYGLPQSLPGHKMASHGADWQTNPHTQLRWMYDYMMNRYGSITAAWNFWQANHWY